MSFLIEIKSFLPRRAPLWALGYIVCYNVMELYVNAHVTCSVISYNYY
jgi:hypothetical protein